MVRIDSDEWFLAVSTHWAIIYLMYIYVNADVRQKFGPVLFSDAVCITELVNDSKSKCPLHSSPINPKYHVTTPTYYSIIVQVY